MIFNDAAFQKYIVGYSQEQEQYSFAFKWGSEGSGNGQFDRPHDVEFDSEGNVYVSDRDLNNTQKFDTEGNFITCVGSGPCRIEEEVKQDPEMMAGPLPCDEHLHQPEHAYVNSKGDLYIVER